MAGVSDGAADDAAADLTRFPFFTSHDFAVLLGLKRSSMNDDRETDDEMEKLRRLRRIYLPRNGREPQEQQDIVWCHFCALYLPALVDHIVDPPALTMTDPETIADFRCWSVYLVMLAQMQHIPYFAKYLRSSKPIAAKGRTLPGILAERLLERAPRWDNLMQHPPPSFPPHYYQGITASALQLMSTITTFIKEPDQERVVRKRIREGLLPWLEKWARRYRENYAGPVSISALSLRLWALLSGKLDIAKTLEGARKQSRSLDTCALPGCNEKPNGKTCAKCRTVCYCTAEHQKEHWKYLFGVQHKQLCHETEY